MTGLYFRTVFMLIFALSFQGITACEHQDSEYVVLVHPCVFFGPDLIMEQSIAAEFKGREILARAVVEKKGDTLKIVLLTPTGQVMAGLVQDGAIIKKSNARGPLNRLDTRRMARDVRWMFFERCITAGDKSNTACIKGLETFHEEKKGRETLLLKIKTPHSKAMVTRKGRIDCNGFIVPRDVVLDSLNNDYRIDARVDRCRILKKSSFP
ncbi:MAG: DUF3261 domain-containing protein [Deltaproteobacteria bacterium]|nr:DUF3261 domain-containing protein [Deltaproteobacteria bacterium]